VSEITDLGNGEILAKYYKNKLTKLDQKKKERKQAQDRLQGKEFPRRNICQTNHRRLRKDQ
jgi:hypothetical protein